MEKKRDQYVFIKGARQNNLKNIDLEIPRNEIVVFTGVSGSGKSSLAFGTLYAEAQRRYLESVSPYARRLFNQMGVPDVDSISGLPPAVALQQQKGNSSSRSTVGSLTTISNSLRMLYSRAGSYPKGMDILYADSFSPNTPEGACPECHGLGVKLDTTEELMVPDPNLKISERAIKGWPGGWHAKNLRDMLTTLGIDVEIPWKKLPKKTRDWILYTDETPSVPVYADFTLKEVKRALKEKEDPSYMGNFIGVRNSILKAYSGTQSPVMRKRVEKFLVEKTCPFCHGVGLKKEALKVKFAGLNIMELFSLNLTNVFDLLSHEQKNKHTDHPEIVKVIDTICDDVLLRLKTIIDLGLEHLNLNRKTPTLSGGELQRLRLATQLRSDLFGVVYVLDEPSAGLHKKDTKALIEIFIKLKEKGNSVFIVEHNKDIIKIADWIVDIGPMAGSEGGEIVYNGPIDGLKKEKKSLTAKYLYQKMTPLKGEKRKEIAALKFEDLSKNNLKDISLTLPLGIMVSLIGVSGSGKTSLGSSLLEIIRSEIDPSLKKSDYGKIISGLGPVKRVIEVNQDPIGRTPRSNIATYTGVFDVIRRLFSKVPLAKKRNYSSSRFSFNVAGGRCENCAGEGYVMVELLFLPSVYSPCPVCKGTRYNPDTLQVKYKNKSIADVLELRVKEAIDFFEDQPDILRGLSMLKNVGLEYIKLGQPATEISGGEAQRVKLASELQSKRNDHTLYLLDEPSTGLHPMDVEKLLVQLQELVNRGNSVIIIDHNDLLTMSSDYIIELGPSGGSSGGKIIKESSLTN